MRLISSRRACHCRPASSPWCRRSSPSHRACFRGSVILSPGQRSHRRRDRRDRNFTRIGDDGRLPVLRAGDAGQSEQPNQDDANAGEGLSRAAHDGCAFQVEDITGGVLRLVSGGSPRSSRQRRRMGRRCETSCPIRALIARRSSAELRDDAVDHRETKSSAFSNRLGGEERFEYSRLGFGRHPRAGVVDGNQHGWDSTCCRWLPRLTVSAPRHRASRPSRGRRD